MSRHRDYEQPVFRGVTGQVLLGAALSALICIVLLALFVR